MSFKLHPLQSAARHAEVMQSHGVTGYHKWLAERRGTGRSTAQALQTLGAVILSPGQPILVQDHHGTNQAARFQRDLILHMAKKLGLQHIHPYDSGDAYVVFEDRTKVPSAPEL